MDTNAIRALVIDDSSSVRGVLKIALTFFGIKVVGNGSNGHEALDLYKTHRPDVVLLDVHMPFMDGFECLVELRKLDPDVFVLMMSADKAPAVEAQAQKLSVGFLKKPLKMDELHKDLLDQLSVHFDRPRSVFMKQDPPT